MKYSSSDILKIYFKISFAGKRWWWTTHPKLTNSHFCFSPIQIFAIDVSTFLIILKYFRVDDGQNQSAKSPQPPDSINRWKCIDPVVLQILGVFTQPEKANIFSLYIIIFQKAQQKGPIDVLLRQPGIKVQTLSALELCIFIVISEARSWWAAVLIVFPYFS